MYHIYISIYLYIYISIYLYIITSLYIYICIIYIYNICIIYVYRTSSWGEPQTKPRGTTLGISKKRRRPCLPPSSSWCPGAMPSRLQISHQFSCERGVHNVTRCYPLVNCYILHHFTMENQKIIQKGKSTNFLWPCSIVM